MFSFHPLLTAIRQARYMARSALLQRRPSRHFPNSWDRCPTRTTLTWTPRLRRRPGRCRSRSSAPWGDEWHLSGEIGPLLPGEYTLALEGDYEAVEPTPTDVTESAHAQSYYSG